VLAGVPVLVRVAVAMSVCEPVTDGVLVLVRMEVEVAVSLAVRLHEPT
jgi:hypothetical protein